VPLLIELLNPLKFTVWWNCCRIISPRLDGKIKTLEMNDLLDEKSDPPQEKLQKKLEYFCKRNYTYLLEKIIEQLRTNEC
jgi:hypothetical protein